MNTEAISSLSPAPSGEQWTIRYGTWEACIVEVGGSLRTLTHDGEPLVHGYDTDAKADAARGHVLAPWPNRIRDGKYSFSGTDYQLPLTEPARHNASHGLTHWQPWSLLDRSESQLTVGLTVHPQPGWDWTLRLETTYTLGETGLTVTASAQHLSSSSCPFGWGIHPYLTVGESSVDELTVTAAVGTEIVVDEQLIPVATRPVDSSFANGRAVDGITLDTCFTDLQAHDGHWRVRVSKTDDPRRSTTLWAEPAFGYLQLFTGDTLPEPRRRRSGLAVEPMTCPANAFNSGDGLIQLAPQEQWTASFGIGH